MKVCFGFFPFPFYLIPFSSFSLLPQFIDPKNVCSRTLLAHLNSVLARKAALQPLHSADLRAMLMLLFCGAGTRMMQDYLFELQELSRRLNGGGLSLLFEKYKDDFG